MNCSPPGSSVHGILPERTLEWAAIPFSNLHSIDEEKWLHQGKITCSNHKYSQRAAGELDQVPYASDSTATDFNHSAWEGPPTDHISAELFLMSYSSSRWITDFHTAVGSRQGWMLQNHAQVQLQNGLTQFQLTVCLKWHEQSCQVVDKISQLTFQLLSLLASPSKAMILAMIYKMMEKEAGNKKEAEVFNILTIKTWEIITYFLSSTKYSMPMRMKTPFLIPDTLWQESERRFPRNPGFHGRNEKSSLSLAS